MQDTEQVAVTIVRDRERNGPGWRDRARSQRPFARGAWRASEALRWLRPRSSVDFSIDSREPCGLPPNGGINPGRVMDYLTTQQHSALARVAGLLEEAGIAHWLFGGWAVDFYVGSVTRAHDDLDLAVWLTDLPRIAQLLDDDGWRHAPLDDEDGGTGYERGAVRLELTYLVRDGDGSVFTPLRQGRAQWSEEALANDVGELRGVRAHL